MANNETEKVVPIVDEDARRKAQQEENEAIGERGVTVDFMPLAEPIDLGGALQRFVFIADGSRVLDMAYPSSNLALPDFKKMYQSSMMVNPADPTKSVPVVNLWERDFNRLSAETITFKAGGSPFVLDPDGRRAFNTWRPFTIDGEFSPEAIKLFEDHLAFLIPDKTTCKRFTQWLAHTMQHPEELPHTMWLHIATSTGMGRNWLASVLARVFAGHTATNLDLVSLLDGNFNGRLSRKLLACVDEIREGGKGQWAHSEKLKSMITAELREIKPKYGREYVEFNACRWLVFSNHRSAIPISSTDRRIEVVVNDGRPEKPEYYRKLYQALKDDAFIQSIRVYLATFDLTGFNAGAHAVWSPEKEAVADIGKSPVAEMADMIYEHWPYEVISTDAILDIMRGGGFEKPRIAGELKHALEDAEIIRHRLRCTLNGRKQVVYTIGHDSPMKLAQTAEELIDAGKLNDGYGSPAWGACYKLLMASVE